MDLLSRGAEVSTRVRGGASEGPRPITIPIYF